MSLSHAQRNDLATHIAREKKRGIDFTSKAEAALSAIERGEASLTKLGTIGWRIIAGPEIFESLTLLPTLVKFYNGKELTP